MVRACCVFDCHSGKNVPSHLFPKNIERRKLWLESLNIKSVEELEMQKLRVCYKHFLDDDYSCSPTRRVLKSTAIPSIHILSTEKSITVANSSSVSSNSKEIHKNCSEAQYQELESQLQEQRQLILQNQNDYNVFVEEQQLKEQQQALREQQQELILQQHEEHIIQQQQLLKQQGEEIEQLKDKITTHLQQNLKSYTRPDLEEISRKNLLTPKARKFYEKTVQLKKEKRRLKRRINELKQSTSKIKVKRCTNKKGRINKTANIQQQFINMILRNSNVAPQARRYTMEEKMFCIGIYRRSRSSYNFLSKYLLCPSTTTLDTQLRHIPLNTGCNNIIFKYLQLVAKEVKDKELYSLLIWDEMSIQPAIYYDSKKDKIIEDWGMKRTRKFADHAIMFYMRCLVSGNHMPIGYGFCQSTTNTIQLVRCIKKWLTILMKCGFKPVATVCDQGATNIAAINLLIEEANRLRRMTHKNPKNTFLIAKQEIIPFYDYVHLQKGIRNNLLTKDLLINKNVKKDSEQFASWDDIITIYEMDKYSFLKQRQMPKLNDKHIFLNMIPKMKVKYATQVISHTVANFMDVVLTFNQGVMNTKKGEMHLSKNAVATSDTILFFDELFDSFNGKKEQGLTSIINNTSNHIKFWKEAYNKLRQMEFVEKKTHKVIRRNPPKCLINWMWTIQSATYLWYVLKTAEFSSFNLKHINQDVLENCFSQIRDNGHRNINPSAFQFTGSFKTIVTTNLTSNHCISSNCEESNEGTSLALLKICRANEIELEIDKHDDDIECVEAAIPEVITKNMFVDAQKILIMIEKKKPVMECEICFKIIKHNCILESVQHALDLAELQFPQFCHEIHIIEKLKNILTEAFSLSMIHCSIVKNIIIDVTAKIFILQWCKFINKILSGKIEEVCDNFIYNQARRMYLKHSKKKK